MARLRRHFRSLVQLQPGRPAVILGLRAALAVTVPYAFTAVLGLGEAGWAGLTGLLVTLGDPGGSYRSRARQMGLICFVGALVGAAAALLGAKLWVDAALLLTGVFAFAFLRAFGETAGTLGNLLAVIFVASLGAPSVGWAPAVERGGVLLFGGVWAMVQGLLLWPIHPHLPARKAVEQVYRGLSEAAADLAALTRSGAAPEEWSAAHVRHLPVRQHIEAAREVLASTRRGRPDESRRLEHLLVLLEQSDPMVAILMALGHAMELSGPDAALEVTRDQVAQAAERAAEVAAQVAQIARDPSRAAAVDPTSPHRSALVISGASLGSVPPTVGELLARLRDHTRAAHDAALGMQRGDPSRSAAEWVLRSRARVRRSLWEPLRENLSLSSVVLRHAARSGVIATASLLIAASLGLAESHWVVLAAIGILQPYSASTEERALHRSVGTLFGALLAVSIAAGIASPLLRFCLIGGLTAFSVSLLPLNFGVFQVLLTPDFLLLATLNVGDWKVAENRAEGLVIACGLALAAVWWLWPSPERHRFPEAAASVLRANGRYFREVAEGRRGTEPDLLSTRREVGLALIDAEASFERMIAEYHGPTQGLEPAMALLSYSRRLVASMTALGEERSDPRTAQALTHVAKETGETLEGLADALIQGSPPPPLPALPVRRREDDPVQSELMTHVPRQLGVVHGAVAKLTAERVRRP